MSAMTPRLLLAVAAALFAGAAPSLAAPDPKAQTGKPQAPKALDPKALDPKAAARAKNPKTAAPASTQPATDAADLKPEKLGGKSGRATRSQVPIVGGPVGPDDFALRYYASMRQTARVNAELARLHTLYPSYEPPADLYEAPASNAIDEEPFWQLFAADKITELKEAIAAKERELPGWRPSADLASKLRRKELRLKISSLWKADKIEDLVDYLKGEDLSELSEEVDVLWTVAEAYARARQNEEAVNMFKRILTTSKDPNIRVATIQKALGSLRMSEVEKLLALVL